MPAWQQQLLAYWQGLQARERLALGVAAVFIVVSLFYGLLWRPMQNDISKWSKDLPLAQKQLARMRVQAAQAKRLRASSRRTGGNANLLTTVEQAAMARGLRQYLNNMEPEGDDGVRLSLEGASFNGVLSLLADLQKQHGLRVETASFQGKPDTPGNIDARLLIRGAQQ